MYFVEVVQGGSRALLNICEADAFVTNCDWPRDEWLTERVCLKYRLVLRGSDLLMCLLMRNHAHYHLS